MKTTLDNRVDRPLDVLLLYKHYASTAATVEDHLCALERYTRHRFFRSPIKGDFFTDLDLKRFDAVVIHYSLIACKDHDISSGLRGRIRRFTGLKAMFIQDEYRHVNETIDAIQDLGVNLLFTCIPESEIEKVYPRAKLPRTRKVSVLTGYVPGYLLGRAVPHVTDRRIDVGYRGRTIPAWLGELGQEKWRIGHRFAEDAKTYCLKCDISYREEDRLYGEAWIKFLSNCKAVLGVESGASVFDFTGEIQRKVEECQARHPEVTFGELRGMYFKDFEGRIKLNQISPRSFECAALRTVMILYEGEYSGILKPWRHYIPLKKDHSNMAEVVEALRDVKLCEGITDNAYGEVARDERYSFKSFAEMVGEELTEAFHPGIAKVESAYSADELAILHRRQTVHLFFDRLFHRIALLILFRWILFWASPELKERIRTRLRRYYHSGLQALGWIRRLAGAGQS